MSIVDPEVEERWKQIPLPERPGGWPEWSVLQVERWKKSKAKQDAKRAYWESQIRRAASEERLQEEPITVNRDYDGPPVMIKATYGPLMGKPFCLISVFEGEVDTSSSSSIMGYSPVDGERQHPFRSIPSALMEGGIPCTFCETDNGSLYNIGPKKFLYHLLKVIAFFGTRSKVQILPNGIEFEMEGVPLHGIDLTDSANFLIGNKKLIGDGES